MLEGKYVYVVVIEYHYDNDGGIDGFETYAYAELKKAKNRVRNELKLIKKDFKNELEDEVYILEEDKSGFSCFEDRYYYYNHFNCYIHKLKIK